MSLPFEITKEYRSHKIGAREVLVLCGDLPKGDLPAARHLRRLVSTLLDFAEQQYCHEAESTLQQAVAKGQIHRFFSYRYLVKLQSGISNELPCLTLTATLSRGSELLYQRRLDSFWSPDHTLQQAPQLKKRRLRFLKKKIASQKQNTTCKA